MPDFAKTRALFAIPSNMIYLDGNSLGPPLRNTAERVAKTINSEWADNLIMAWNNCGWMSQPTRVGDRIARLIGAPSGSVVMGDTLSIKVFQAVAAGLALRPNRRVILSDTGNFPTDLYMVEGLMALKPQGYQLKTVAPEEVEAAIDESVAVLLLTEVDYRTGRIHNMRALTERAHAKGAITVWDLAHSTGALPVTLESCEVDFAVGCTYKYVNGGPGAPAFIYVRPDLAEKAITGLSGWIGHAAPFSFELHYRPAAGAERMRVGTPPILGLSSLEAALDVFDMVTMGELRARSMELTDLFISEVERQAPQLALFSPRDASKRGSQVSFRHPHAYPIMQVLIANGVVGDVRAPDVLRFGFAPLYISIEDVQRAAKIIGEVLEKGTWQDPKYSVRAAVT